MTAKETLKQWFKTGSKPTQEQFWAWMDSYFHKAEKLPIEVIEGINDILTSKADKSVVDQILIILDNKVDKSIVQALEQVVAELIDDTLEESNNNTYSISKIKSLLSGFIKESVLDISYDNEMNAITVEYVNEPDKAIKLMDGWKIGGNDGVENTGYIGTLSDTPVSIGVNNVPVITVPRSTDDGYSYRELLQLGKSKISKMLHFVENSQDPDEPSGVIFNYSRNPVNTGDINYYPTLEVLGYDGTGQLSNQLLVAGWVYSESSGRWSPGGKLKEKWIVGNQASVLDDARLMGQIVSDTDGVMYHLERVVDDITKFRKSPLGHIIFDRKTDKFYVRTSQAWEQVQLNSDTGWQELTLSAGLSNFGSGFSSAKYRKINNRVFVEGIIKGGVSQNMSGNDYVLFTLPAGFRPLERQLFITSAFPGTNEYNNKSRIDLLPNGQAMGVIYNAAATSIKLDFFID